MSLISLLIALMAERHLSSPAWQFSTYYQHYLTWLDKKFGAQNVFQNTLSTLLMVLVPVLLLFLLINLLDSSLFEFIISTLVLILCLGCVQAREAYKCFLRSAFRGEITTCEINRQQLLQEKGLEEQGFGQALVWLNYRYFIAIIIFFVLFGAPGAVFYRLLTALVEQPKSQTITINSQQKAFITQVLALIDWLPVRITAFGYMFVGHFSNALTTWLESLYDVNRSPNKVLTSVAQVAEDFLVDEEDCTAEPCLLVRLAKRNLLLLLAVISILTLLGVIN